MRIEDGQKIEEFNIEKIGKRFRKVREYFEYTIEEIAQILRENPDTIRNIEEGKQLCSVDLLWKYAKYFEINLNWLVLGIEPMFLGMDKAMIARGSNIVQVRGNNNIVERPVLRLGSVGSKSKKNNANPEEALEEHYVSGYLKKFLSMFRKD